MHRVGRAPRRTLDPPSPVSNSPPTTIPDEQSTPPLRQPHHSSEQGSEAERIEHHHHECAAPSRALERGAGRCSCSSATSSRSCRRSSPSSRASMAPCSSQFPSPTPMARSAAVRRHTPRDQHRQRLHRAVRLDVCSHLGRRSEAETDPYGERIIRVEQETWSWTASEAGELAGACGGDTLVSFAVRVANSAVTGARRLAYDPPPLFALATCTASNGRRRVSSTTPSPSPAATPTKLSGSPSTPPAHRPARSAAACRSRTPTARSPESGAAPSPCFRSLRRSHHGSSGIFRGQRSHVASRRARQRDDSEVARSRGTIEMRDAARRAQIATRRRTAVIEQVLLGVSARERHEVRWDVSPPRQPRRWRSGVQGSYRR